MALETLTAVSEIAGQMAAAAEELHREFDNEANKVREVAKKTKKSQGEQASLVEDFKKQKEEARIRHRHQQEIYQEGREAEAEAELRYREYEIKEDAAIEQLGDLSVLNKVANAVTSTFLRRPTQMYRGDEAAKQ